MHSEFGLAGPLLTPGFLAHGLPEFLARRGLYPIEPAVHWRSIQRGLRDFAAAGGPVRVLHHVVNPLATALGYDEIRREEPISTREGPEDGGYTLRISGQAAGAGASLRSWAVGSDIDLDTPSKRGTAARISPMRRASRVLRVRGECIGIVTNGEALRLLFCDPSGPDSHIVVPLGGRAGWVSRPDVPESYRLIFAMASPGGVAAVSEIFDAARMHQTAVT